MSRAETAVLLVDLVLNGCGVSSFQEFAELVNHEDGARAFLSMCRAAAAQPLSATLLPAASSRLSAAPLLPTACE